MKRRRLMILCAIALVIIIAIIICIFVVKSNTQKTLNCKSLSNDMEVIFKGNKPVFVRGKIDISDVEKIDDIKESMSMHGDVIHLNEKTKTIKYAFKYNELNSSVLNFVGLNYDKKLTYDKVKDNLENSNYYCK